jgi:aminoglycoside phosphotransferase (APT) family kinase protein
MWDEYRITAMLDWEMSLNGEPLADLGYMLYLFESEYHAATRAQKLSGMLKRDQVISLWEEVSGRSARGIIWHEIAQIAKISAIIAEGTNMFNTGRSSDPKLAYFKQNLDQYLGVVAAMLAGSGY